MNGLGRNSQIACRIFGVKDPSYVSKGEMIKSIVKLAAEFEQVCLELYAVDPVHKRFNMLPEIEHKSMQKRAVYCKKSIKFYLATIIMKIKNKFNKNK
jgi:hypothetical protein